MRKSILASLLTMSLFLNNDQTSKSPAKATSTLAEYAKRLNMTDPEYNHISQGGEMAILIGGNPTGQFDPHMTSPEYTLYVDGKEINNDDHMDMNEITKADITFYHIGEGFDNFRNGYILKKEQDKLFHLYKTERESDKDAPFGKKEIQGEEVALFVSPGHAFEYVIKAHQEDMEDALKKGQVYKYERWTGSKRAP